MAALPHQGLNCGVATEDSTISCSSEVLSLRESCRDTSKWWNNHNSKPIPHFKHIATGPPLRLDSSSEEVIAQRLIGLPCHGAAHIDSVVASIRACTRSKDLSRGTTIHHDLLQRGLLRQYSDALVTMYAKCGDLGNAKALLDMHKSKDAIIWTTLIAGFAREGQAQNAINYFEQMLCEGILPNKASYVHALKACATIGAAERGKQIYDEIVRHHLLQNDVVLGNALVDMYVKCKAFSKAQRVLDELPCRDVVSWNTLMAGYAQEGEAELALRCFEQMRHEGIVPNAVTYVCILKACASSRAAKRGKQIHEEIASEGLLQNNVMVGNALMNMYAKCRAMSKARQVLEELPLRNVISWNTLIGGYAEEGDVEQALECLDQMQHDRILPDAVTYVCVLKACTMSRAADRGKQLHDEITKQALLHNNIALGGALVDMYAKCGDILEAQWVFQELPSRDVVSWSALIAGYAIEGEAEEALNCLEQMQRESIVPNAITFVCALKACATIRATERGKKIHDEIVRQGLLQSNVVLGGALVDMYAKCGDVLEAQWVLEELPFRNSLCWNALIAGYAQKGEAEQALNCLEQMQCEGILPDAESCACVLSVCSHRGLVEQGQELFGNMTAKYGLKPSIECYTAMIDLLGRAGHLEKAVRLVQEMPSSSSAIWHALLGAFQKWADVNLGEWAFKQAVKLDESDGPAYVLMTNIYAEAGMEEKARRIEAMRIRNKAWKKPGASCKGTLTFGCTLGKPRWNLISPECG